MKFKEIRLLPSHFTLDVIVVDGSDAEDVVKFVAKRYGIPEHDCDAETILNSVTTIRSGMDTVLKGHKRVLMTLDEMDDDATLVHELVHVMWHTAKCCGWEMSYQSQEWQSLTFEYLFTEFKKPNFKTIKTNKQK